MAEGDRLSSATVRWWNAAAVFLLALYVLGLALFAYAVLRITRGQPPPFATTPLRAYSESYAWWPIAVQLVLGLSAFGAYYVPRRHETRTFSLLVTGGLGFTTIVLGVFSVWNCRGEESAFFSPLTAALGLILGSTPTLKSPCDNFNNALPLALQVARLFGPLLIVITALGIVATLFRAQLDRLIVRFSRSLVVVVGLSEDAIPLLRRLATDLGRRSTLAVLIEDAANPLIRLTRNIGARVVVCDLDKANSIRVLVIRQGRFKVHALYVVSADVSANLGWAKQFRDIADASKTASTDEPPRITVRIDDPWQAEYWRRTNAYRTPEAGRVDSVRWVSDALSVYEVTASILVAHVQKQPHDRLVIVGNSPLALAVCAELAQREREGAVLRDHPAPSFGDLVLVGPDAEALREQHQIRQERFGNSAELGAIDVAVIEASEPGLADILARDESPAVVFADDLTGTRKEDLSATLLAALHPEWTIYHTDTATRGLAPRPIMERLFPFGLTIEPPEGAAVDSWERAARVVHQTFLKSLGDQLDPTKPAHRPWTELSTFYKESNIRLVTATLAGAESVHRTWGPAQDRSTKEVSTSVEPKQLVEMAKFEHRSWRQFYRDNGWRYGPNRNDAKRIHNALVPWEQLSEAYRKRTVDNVKDALSTLYALGYRSSMVTERPWTRVSRRGEVTAVQLTTDWTWTTASGDVLHARAGDYKVSDGRGRAWSVEREIFENTYAPLDGDRWRRVGTVSAQPALAGELVISMEGPEFAHAEDWVIKGSAGEQWITSAAHFDENYQPVGG